MDLGLLKAFFSGEKISYNSALKQFESDKAVMRSAYQGTLHSKLDLVSGSEIAKLFLQNIQAKFSTSFDKRWIEESPRIIQEFSSLNSEVLGETITKIKQAQFLFSLTHPQLNGTTPAFLRDDPSFVLKALKLHPESSQVVFASERLKHDKAFMMELIRIDPSAARHASLELKNDKEFILALVELDFRLFYLASDELKKDALFMKQVIVIAPSSVREADEELLNDLSFMTECLDTDFRAAFYAGVHLKKNPEFMLKAVKKSLLVLKAIDESLLDNLAFMKQIVELYPHAASCASDMLKSNKEFAFFVLEKNPKFFEQLHVSLRSDPEVTFFAMQKDKTIFHFAQEDLCHNLDFLKKISIELDCFDLVPEEIKSLESFCLDVLEKKPDIYSSIPRSLQYQIYFNLAACRRNHRVYELLANRMQKIPAIIICVLKENPEAILNAQPIDLYEKDFLIQAIIENPAVVFYLPVDWVGDLEIFNTVIYGLASTYSDQRFVISKINDRIFSEIVLKKQAQAVGDYKRLLDIDLPAFVNTLSFDQLKCTQAEQQVKKDQMLSAISLLKTRIESKTPYVGAPNTPAQLELFYAQVTYYLSHLQSFFENHPDAIQERLQLIRGMSVCGGGLIADLNQLYSLYCETDSDLSIEAKLALWRNKLIRRFIESSAQDSNVHLANILQYQLSSYLYEDPIAKDPLIDPIDESELMYLFYDALNVETLVKELKETMVGNEGLTDGIVNYIHDKMFLSKPVPQEIQDSLEQELESLNEPLDQLMTLKEEIFSQLGQFNFSEISALATAKDPAMLQLFMKKLDTKLSLDLANEMFCHQKKAKQLVELLYLIKPLTSLGYQSLLESTKSFIQVSAFTHLPHRAKEALEEAFDEKYRQSDGSYQDEGLALVLASMGLVESL